MDFRRKRNTDSERSSAQERQHLNDANDDMIDELSSKVSALKNITIGLGKQAELDNAMLNGTDRSMGGVAGILDGSMQRLNHMMNSGGAVGRTKLCCGLTVVFFFIYWFFIRSSSG